MGTKSGRPRRQYAVVTVAIKLTLVKGEDDDLITMLAQTPNGLRAITVKSALRGQMLMPTAGEHVHDPQIADELAGFVL